MTQAIVIAVTDGFGGYGDFLFALKLVEQLRKYYEKQGGEVPPVYIVTQQSGKDKIEKLQGNIEFGVDIVTPEDLKKKIETKAIDVGHLIEAPVFSNQLMHEIDGAFESLPAPIPLLMIPEYSYNGSIQRTELTEVQAYRAERLIKIKYENTIYPGFMQAVDETGILLTEFSAQDNNAIMAKLDQKIRTPLFRDQSIEAYQQHTELSFQYSHDTYDTVRPDSAAQHFLKVHHEFSKQSNKNQDVVMVGKAIDKKKEALRNITEQLIANGYTRISFFNADTDEEEMLHNSGEGKSYRVIYTAGLTHQSMIACMALSGPLAGATGDQSFGEAVSADKLMVYECLGHKIPLIYSYDEALQQESNGNPGVTEALYLLRNAQAQMEYQRLGELLRDPKIQAAITEANRGVLKRYDLVSKIVKDGLLWKVSVCKIASYLKQDRQEDALHLFRQLQDKITIFDKHAGQSLWKIAIHYNKKGVFCKYFDNNPKAMLMQYLAARQELDAYQYMKEQKISLFSTKDNLPIFQKILDLKLYELAEKIIKDTTNHQERVALSAILHANSPSGETYLAQLRKDRPLPNPTTAWATFEATLAHFDKYYPKPGSPREIMFESIIELTKTFNALSIYDEKATIGLLLLNKKNIAAEYKFFSPNNRFFGSKFHKILDNALKGLGVDLSTITPMQEREYFDALTETINKQPDFLGNEYVLQSLSKQAGVKLPLISRLPTSVAHRILSKQQSVKDPSILWSGTGFYKINPECIGRGGWGTVYAGVHYSAVAVNEGVAVSQPLAVKQVKNTQGNALDKECRLFKQAYPQGQFQRFDHGKFSYLAMPLFPGVRVHDYLPLHSNLAFEDRINMAKDLLENLNTIHAQGITHNDLKTKNILFNPLTKKMHIIDFGCAEEHGTFMRYNGMDTAVFAFEIPPEYLDGVHSTPSLDVFAVTPILAEIFGINKNDIVHARMEKAFESMEDDTVLKESLRQAFFATNNIEEAIFHPLVNAHRDNPNLQQFIKEYVKTPYDFHAYKEVIGEDLLDLLNKMQDQTPSNRPSLSECIEKISSLGGYNAGPSSDVTPTH